MKPAILSLAMLAAVNQEGCQPSVQPTGSNTYTVTENSRTATIQFCVHEGHTIAIATSDIGIAMCEVTPDSLTEKPEP